MKLLICTLEFPGFRKEGILKYTFLGLLFGITVFTIAYGVEFSLALAQGKVQSLQLYVSSYAVDGNIGKRTAAFFYHLYCRQYCECADGRGHVSKAVSKDSATKV